MELDMTADDLRKVARREPFHAFTIHLNDGSRLKVSQPDNFFLPPSWRFEAIVVFDDGRWTILNLRNIAHVTTRGHWPKLGKRKRNGSTGGDE
jgi:hypothetical protein